MHAQLRRISKSIQERCRSGQLMPPSPKAANHGILSLHIIPSGKAGAELLFDVIATTCERNRLIVTTNLPLENWIEVLGRKRPTGAVLDRLTHRGHILETEGKSGRLQDARSRRHRPDSAAPDRADDHRTRSVIVEPSPQPGSSTHRSPSTTQRHQIQSTSVAIFNRRQQPAFQHFL